MDRREAIDRRQEFDRRIVTRRDTDRKSELMQILTGTAAIAVIVAVCVGIILGSLMLLLAPGCT